MTADAVAGLVATLKIENDMGSPVDIKGHYIVSDSERLARYSSAYSALGADLVVAVTGEADGETVEYLYVLSGADNLTPVMGECAVMMMETPPTTFLEYQFPEDLKEDLWRLSSVTPEAVDQFKSLKFSDWKHQLEEPHCEAAFRRLLQMGVVSRVFDKGMFPTPDHLKHEYQVLDDRTGKLVDIPHPVAKMRIWNAKERTYDDYECILRGAPTEEEADQWWQSFLADLREKRGKEYIDDLIAGKESGETN